MNAQPGPSAVPTERQSHVGTDRWSIRLGAVAIAAGGVLFLLYQAVRPYSDESSLAGAAAIGSAAWIVAHLFGVAGFILVTLGLLALAAALRATAARAPALIATVLFWVGAGLTLPYYGAEVFGLNAIAQRALQRHDPALMELANTVRYSPAAATEFAVGLLLVGIGAILAAVAIWRSGLLPRWSGIPFAAGFALFIPQFFTNQPIRIAHGALVAIGCIWIALGMWSSSTDLRKGA